MKYLQLATLCSTILVSFALLISIILLIGFALTLTACSSAPPEESTAASTVSPPVGATPLASISAESAAMASATESITSTLLPPPTPPPPTPDCATLPAGNFLTVWQDNPTLQTRLGCPTSTHPRIEPQAWEVETSYQPFEQGAMIWSNKIGWYQQPVIFVHYPDSTFMRIEDTFNLETDTPNREITPPPGQNYHEPLFGFGKVWREYPDVQERLGWATAEETIGTGRFQLFYGGNVLWISQTNQTYVYLFDNNELLMLDIPFAEN